MGRKPRSSLARNSFGFTKQSGFALRSVNWCEAHALVAEGMVKKTPVNWFRCLYRARKELPISFWQKFHWLHAMPPFSELHAFEVVFA